VLTGYRTVTPRGDLGNATAGNLGNVRINPFDGLPFDRFALLVPLDLTILIADRVGKCADDLPIELVRFMLRERRPRNREP
jgi:hypothetical protein